MRLVALLVPILTLLPIAGCASDKGPTTPVPATPAVASASSAPVDAPVFFPPPTSIGEATMLTDGTLVVSNPHQVSRIAPSDPKYAEWLAHLGGIKPGEAKNMPAWPDEFDAARVEAAVRAYLARKGIGPRGCHGDILGTDPDKNVTVSVGCMGAGVSLRLAHDSYAVTELP